MERFSDADSKAPTYSLHSGELDLGSLDYLLRPPPHDAEAALLGKKFARDRGYIAIHDLDFYVNAPGHEKHMTANFQPFHLYCICTRPTVRIIPEECDLRANPQILEFEVECDDRKRRRQRVRMSFPMPGTSIVSDTDGLSFYVEDNDSRSGRREAAIFLDRYLPDAHPTRRILDLEIRYIGQSQGEELDRDALVRLKTHEKYIAVFEETQRTNREPWIILLEHGEIGRLWIGEAQTEGEARHVIKDSENINLTEAYLINIFQPEHNDKFKGALNLTRDTFRCLRRHYGLAHIVFNTAPLGVWTYSDHRPAAEQHSASWVIPQLPPKKKPTKRRKKGRR